MITRTTLDIEFSKHKEKGRLLSKMSLLFMSIFIVGLTSIYFEIHKTNIELQNDFSRESNIVASSLQSQQISSLSGKLSDTVNPNYKTLKKQLMEMRKAIPDCRFIYLMGMRSDSIIFFVDSEPSQSHECSPPGQIYSEANPAIYKVFKGGNEISIGPFTDRWGTWRSNFKAIKSSENGRVVAVLGVDVSSINWLLLILELCAIPILLIIVTCVFVFLAFSFGRKAVYNKQRAENIAESEEKFRVMFLSHKAVMLLIDPDSGQIINANNAAEIFYGYSLEKLCSMNIKDINCSEQYFIRESMHKAFKQENNEFIFTHKLANGNYRIVQVLSSPFQTSDGNYLFSIINDVTDKFEAEKRTSISEQRFKEFASAVDHVFVLRTKEKVLFVNEQFETIFGIPCEYLYKNPRAFLPYMVKEDRQKIFDNVQRNDFSVNGHTNEEYRIIKPNGELRWMWSKTFPIVNEDGTVDKIAIVVSDITEKKKMEEEKLLANQNFESIFKTSPDPIVIMRASDGIITDVNEQFLKISGYFRDELVGKTSADLTAYKNIQDRNDAITELKENGFFINKKVVFNTKYNKSIDCILSSKTIVLQNTLHYITTIRDITQLSEIENELIKSKEIAIAASVAKSDFLATMSHEIRTPLNGVIGFSEIVMKTTLTEKQYEYVKNINISANSLLDLVNDILDFSKIEAGKLELHTERIDLHELLESVIDIMRFRVIEKGVESLLNIPSNVPQFVVADSIRLRQVLINLLGNAWKFTEQGEIELKVVAQEIIGNKSEMSFTFSVCDTGIGIPSSKLKEIFQSFSQADSSTTRKYGGSGLGLAISSSLVAKMGSQIEVDSQEGKGSCFYFTITLPIESYIQTNITENTDIHKVLIVDDNATNRLIIDEMLQVQNITTEQAPNGLIALEKIGNSDNYDLVIVDFQMPYVDGLQVVQNIRDNENTKHLNVILLHNSIEDELFIEECKRLKVKRILQKPIKRNQLYNTLLKINSTENFETEKELNHESTIENVSYNNIKILIVDDNQMNLNLASSLVNINMPNAEVIVTRLGTEACDLYCKHKPDIVLLDIQMPIMNGYEVAKAIRETVQDDQKRVPIIALTAGTVVGEKERCLEAGMDDYLSKPLKSKQLFLMIDKYLNGNNEIEISETNVETLNLIHFDIEDILKIYDNNEDFVKKLVIMALQSIPQYIEDLRLAVESNNSDGIKFNAHTIKGMAKGIGFNILSDYALQIEQNNDIDIKKCTDFFILLSDEYQYLKNQLQRN